MKARQLQGGEPQSSTSSTHQPVPPDDPNFLPDQKPAWRGAYLRRPGGSHFMPVFDPRGLAPRDMVARAIDHEMKRLGADCVYLDISHKPASSSSTSPTIFERALPRGGHRHHQGGHAHRCRRHATMAA